MPLSNQEFTARLIASGLFTQSSLTDHLSKISVQDQPQDGEQLAKQLVKLKLLTPYQAQTVYSGKVKQLVLGNYVVVDKLGQGGMGLVLKAVHQRMGRTVALKVLSPEAVKTPSLVERFHREVRAAAKLEHPNIVTAFDADEANGTHFLVMQFVDGKDLSVTVREQGMLPVDRALDYVLQAARGLEFAHKHGVTHRDIKPSNLLLGKDGVIKILDMGLARIDNPLGEEQGDHSLTGTGTVMGTIDYMSPEQALNTKYADARSDQYSLGITLYYLLTGKPAYSGSTAMEKLLAHRDDPLPSLGGAAGGELNAIFQKMIAKKSADRFPSMTEVIAALTDYQHRASHKLAAPVARPVLSGSQEADAALEAFLQQPLRTVVSPSVTHAKTSGATKVQKPLAAPTVAEEATFLSSGPADDTATSELRRKPELRGLSLRRRGVLFAGAAVVIVIGLLALLPLLQPGGQKPGTGSTAQNEGDDSGDSSPITLIGQSDGWHGRPQDAPPPAIAPFNAAQAKKHQDAWAKYLNVPVEYTNAIGMKFRLIPPGEFLMGNTDEERRHITQRVQDFGMSNDHWQQQVQSGGPQHRVILTQPFYLLTHEVTQQQFETVVGSNPSYFSPGGGGREVVAGKNTSQHPVESVDWDGAARFCSRLSKQQGFQSVYRTKDFPVTVQPGNGYRLPSEAEWEYACRAGTTTAFWTGDTEDSTAAADWTGLQKNEFHAPVSQLQPNPFGLFDLHGNVSEWVEDVWAPDFYRQFAEMPAVNPVCRQAEFDYRVLRGTHYNFTPIFGTAGQRYGSLDSGSAVGFRVALSVEAVRQDRGLKGPAIPEPPAPNRQPVAGAGDAPQPAKAPFDAAPAKKHQESWAQHLGVPVEYTNSIGMKFRLIPPGDFLMGSTAEEIQAAIAATNQQDAWTQFIQSEAPRHLVTLTQPIYIGVQEVTQAQYQLVTGNNPSHFSPTGEGKDLVAGRDTQTHPVEMTSWHDAVRFLAQLSEREQLSASEPGFAALSDVSLIRGYRLPTEAEWEFACRAGTQSPYWCGDTENSLAKAARFEQNAGEQTYPVGGLSANPFGLFDTHGNVMEWVHDRWKPNYYAEFANRAAKDPAGPEGGIDQRVLRGGHIKLSSSFCRSAIRNADAPTATSRFIGFRAVLPVAAIRNKLAMRTPQSTIEFDGDADFIEIADFPPKRNEPATVEAWVKPALGEDAANIVSWLGPNWVTLFQSGAQWGVSQQLDGKSLVLISDAKVVPGAWVHLSATYSGDQLQLFINGQPAVLTPQEFELQPTEQGLFLGGCPIDKLKHYGERWFQGELRAARISDGIRHTESFTPAENFAVDDDTLGLYELQDDEGDVLTDSSGKQHHGKIVGGKWIRHGDEAVNQNAPHVWPADAPRLAVAPFNADEAKQHQEECAAYLQQPVEIENSLGMKFRLVPPGEFQMGSTAEEIEPLAKAAKEVDAEFFLAEMPQARVQVPRPFYVGVTEVTQGIYARVMKSNPSQFNAAAMSDQVRLPVETIYWMDAIRFCNQLSKLEGLPPYYEIRLNGVRSLSGEGYRLPLEAEWELACLAPEQPRAEGAAVRDSGWFEENSKYTTHPVGLTQPNAFGLFDLHGNVWEWCWDQAAESHKSRRNPLRKPDAAPRHIVRGASWAQTAHFHRTTARYQYGLNDLGKALGMRVVRSVRVRNSAAP